MASYDFYCPACGRGFAVQMTAEESISRDQTCDCGGRARRQVPVPGGIPPVALHATIKMQDRNYVSNRLPLRMPGARHTDAGKTIVEGRQHEERLAHAAFGGYERE